jgi:hypothetical protein
MVPPLLAGIYQKNRGFFHRVIRDVFRKKRNSASFFKKVTLFLSRRGWNSGEDAGKHASEGNFTGILPLVFSHSLFPFSSLALL